MGRRKQYEVIAYMKAGTACFRRHKSAVTVPYILWHVDPFLDNNREISKHTIAATK
jgi:hypothetical protein